MIDLCELDCQTLAARHP